jgi:signal transduction histidine kinase
MARQQQVIQGLALLDTPTLPGREADRSRRYIYLIGRSAQPGRSAPSHRADNPRRPSRQRRHPADSCPRAAHTAAEGLAERHCVSLQTHLSPDVPRVLGDRMQLRQVLLNLLMNAI